MIAYEAFTAGAYTEDGTMLELDLNEVGGFPKGFYYKDISGNFKKAVKEIYEERKVTVADDLQKNRWGGKSVNNGKRIRASVARTLLLPVYFRITIEIISEDKNRPLAGDVAFFLHNTFSDEIKYRKARNGIAKITIRAYEAFTIGAYTEDGTMLELDLQQQKGYPIGFYYKEDGTRGKEDEEEEETVEGEEDERR